MNVVALQSYQFQCMLVFIKTGFPPTNPSWTSVARSACHYIIMPLLILNVNYFNFNVVVNLQISCFKQGMDPKLSIS